MNCQPWGIIRIGCRRYGSKRRLQRMNERDEIVHEITGPESQRTTRLYGCGFSATGALGIDRLIQPKNCNPIDNLRHPMRLNFFPKKGLKVRAFGCGYGFTVFVCKSSKEKWQLYGCGLNSDSQIGLQNIGIEGNIGESQYIQLLKSPSPILTSIPLTGDNVPVSVSCGRAHTVFRTVSGSIFSLGNNAFGQCGREVIEGEIFFKNAVVSPIKIPFDVTNDQVINVVCGQDHSIFLTKSGHVYSCGLGSDGQLGLGHYENAWQPTRVKGEIEDKTITNIACRGDTVLACCSDGYIYGWGNSEYAQLSESEIQLASPRRLFIDSDVGHVKQVAASGSSCAVLNTDGHIYVWGYGLLGHGPQVTKLSTPKLLPPPLFGMNELDPGAVVRSIGSGLHHYVAVNNRGVMFSWGSNRSGCLGLGQEEDQTFPLRVSIPAEIISVECGVDHVIISGKSFA